MHYSRCFTHLPSRVNTGGTLLADDSASDLHAHSSVTFEDPAIGCSASSASALLVFFDARDFFGDSCGGGTESLVLSCCVNAPPGGTSTATGIVVGDTVVVRQKTCQRLRKGARRMSAWDSKRRRLRCFDRHPAVSRMVKGNSVYKIVPRWREYIRGYRRVLDESEYMRHRWYLKQQYRISESSLGQHVLEG